MEQLQLPSHRDDHPCALTAEEEEVFRSYRPRATDLFTGDTVKEVMSQADAGVAGGCSGWRNEHFKGAAETDLGLAALTTIMLAMAQGDCGSPYSENGNMHVWDASRLIALVKGDEWTGAENTRPIAIGETLRRLTGKSLLRARREVMERRALTIHNFAFTSDGCSNVVKLAQLYTHEHPDHGVLNNKTQHAGIRTTPGTMAPGKGLLADVWNVPALARRLFGAGDITCRDWSRTNGQCGTRPTAPSPNSREVGRCE